MASHGWPIGQRDRQVDNHSKLDWHEQNIIADKIERRRQRISQLPKQTYIQTATTSYHTWQKLSKAAMTVATTLFWRTPLRALEYPNKGLKLHPHSQWGSPPRGTAWQPPSFHLACRKAGAGQDLLSRTGTEHQTGKDPAKWIKEPMLSDARPCHLSTGAVPKRPAQPSTQLPALPAQGQNTITPASSRAQLVLVKAHWLHSYHSGTRMGPKQEKKWEHPLELTSGIPSNEPKVQFSPPRAKLKDSHGTLPHYRRK